MKKEKRKNLIKLLLLTLVLLTIPAITKPVKAANVQNVSKSTAKALNGWVTSGGRRYYFVNGKKVTGWRVIGSYVYYFNNYGQALTYRHKINGRWYYFNSYGQRQHGWQTINGYRYYYDKTYGHLRYGWLISNGNRYYLNSSGRALTGWQKIGGYRYYFNSIGRALTGWQTIGGYRCYFNAIGQAQTGTKVINGIQYTFNSYGRVIAQKDLVVYRGVAIGEASYGQYATALPSCKNDAEAMVRLMRKTGYTTARSGINCTRNQIYNLIQSTFAAANSNDISFFYFSGHSSSSGSLYTVYGEYIASATLANWLSQIPGTVIVMLDCCYSGTVISKDSSGAVDIRDAKKFNNNVISAFSQNDLVSKSGEMRTGKFQVLTACSMNQLSYCNKNYSLFTEKLISGAGYDYASGSKRSIVPADYDRNNKLSLYECWRYTYLNIRNQDAQCYPSNSSFKVFQRY